MRVVIDSGIPFLQGVLEPFAQVAYLSPEMITADAVRDADALFIRTRTRIDNELLSGSRVRFVATATQQACDGCRAQAATHKRFATMWRRR